MDDKTDQEMQARMRANFEITSKKQGSAQIGYLRRKLNSIGAFSDDGILGDRVSPKDLLEAAGPEGQLKALYETKSVSAPGDVQAAIRAAASGRSYDVGGYSAEDLGLAPPPSQVDVETMRATKRAIGALDVQTSEAARRLAVDYLSHDDSAASRVLEAEVTRSDAARTFVYGDWRVEPHVKTGKNGKDTIRYIAAGPRNKTYPYEFRHKSAAALVAAALNETGGLFEDRRIARVVELSEEESKQLAEYNQHKRMIEATDPSNAKRIGNHRNLMELAQSKVKQIRAILGA